MKSVVLDGHSLDLAKAIRIACGASIRVDEKATRVVAASRKVVEKLAAGPKPVYGINTGFGFFANKKIKKSDLDEIQHNIIRSHAGGFGEALPEAVSRLALTLRLNLMLKGFSGVRVELCEFVAKLLDAGIHPVVPQYGSVGASGDLIPLAHLALPLIGEGSVFYKGAIVKARKALKSEKLRPIELKEKEGLGFINGTEIMQATGAMALADGLRLLLSTEKITALSFEALEGLTDALDPRIHQARGQTGQMESAAAILAELKGSGLFSGKRAHKRVQDPYSLRCAPQIHGASRDALAYARMVLEREFNAVTDNPLVFAKTGDILSGGNFHGQPLALALDFAAMALAELGSVSDRRLELLCNPHQSGLPAFLAKDGGTNSGYMVLQYLSASLVNENRLLANPACTDSIPGNVGIEDHVSMGMTSARKLGRIANNLKAILACELLAACQAIDLRKSRRLGKGTRRSYARLRSKVRFLGRDRIVAEDIEQSVKVVEGL